MGRKRKKPKVKKLRDEDILGIHFEIEDDADEVFAEYLERMPQSLDAEIFGDEQESAPEHIPNKQSAGKDIGQSSSVSTDLHGFHLDDAIFHIDSTIRELLVGGPRIIQLKVITGKGLHSGPQGGILAREVHAYVSKTFRKNIVRIDESPADVTLNGVPIRGHFIVVLKRIGS